ncbi:hypothetical protein NUW58_g3595 [Xylaria curta]|uniref:Uncharacterized protein n=1 Tax=Xylaria curta TaxID=42375 RepID=A0ACC1PCK8_9PEZI|nr:hypothetical protein NUW58_g3595 [Xylaria curta]
MASSKPRIFTYHIAPHFNIAATDGALRLGTVVKDLLELAPLNKGEANYEPVPDDEIYTPTLQTGFHATRTQLLSGNAGGEWINKETFSCDGVMTTYFDPTGEWVAKCLAAKPINDYIVGSGYKKEVYIVTGSSARVREALVVGFIFHQRRRVLNTDPVAAELAIAATSFSGSPQSTHRRLRRAMGALFVRDSALHSEIWSHGYLTTQQRGLARRDRDRDRRPSRNRGEEIRAAWSVGMGAGRCDSNARAAGGLVAALKNTRVGSTRTENSNDA